MAAGSTSPWWITVSHYIVKFGGIRYCDSGDIMFLVCYMIKQDHVIEQSGEYINRSLL